MDKATERLRVFNVISSQTLRSLVEFAPIGIILLLLVDLLIGSSAFVGDAFRLSGVLVIAIEIFVLNYLFGQLRDTLELVWKRNLLSDANDTDKQEAYIQYIDEFDLRLNSRWAVGVGVLGAIAGIVATYPIRYFFQTGTSPFDFGDLARYYIWGNAAIVAVPLGYILGLLFWRVGVIAIFISKLGRRFDIRIQINHPDKCGGLKPIGNLTLVIALLILIPAIFLSFWGFTNIFLNSTSGAIYEQLWSGLFRQWLVFLSVLAFVVFLWPLYSIHRQMRIQSYSYFDELNDLALRIDTLSTELRTQADTLSLEQGEDKLKTMEFLDRVYKENNRIPTWPIDWKIIIKFSSAQIVPVLSILGTSETIIKLVESLLSATK
jgi:hypothetical protein